MAGMLPGVETARKRRIHHTSYPTLISSSSHSQYFRHSSLSPFSGSITSSSLEQDQLDDKLGQMAREAKERLHQRLRPHTKSPFTRNNSDVRRSEKKGGRELRTQVYGASDLKKKELEREEERVSCPVCLEEYRVGENVVKLPCAHTFHSRCMLPWLPTHPLCPCCRISILP